MSIHQEFDDTSSDQPPVRGFLHLPVRGRGDALILTHGAGANCSSPLLIALAESFCDAGFIVLRCDLPFRQDRPKGPPPRGSAERDQQGLRAAITSIKRRHAPDRMYVGGHSYGGRQASMLAATEPGLMDALLLLSYPLHPPRRPDDLRTQHFPHLETPALFVHGTCDGFGSIAELTAAVNFIPARTQLLPIDAAGHELMTKRNRAELPSRILRVLQSFVGDETV